MNIPIFQRAEFDRHMASKGLPTSDFLFNDYRSFIINKFVPIREPAPSVQIAPRDAVQKIGEITTAVATPGFKISIEDGQVTSIVKGHRVSDIETTEVFKIAA